MKQELQVPIRSLGKAMELLDILLERSRPMSLRELAEASGYPKSTVYTLLSSMRAYSYIEQRADGRYFLGIRMYECGRAVSAEWDISAVARPYLERLAETAAASAVLTYLEGGSIINLEQATSRAGVQVRSEMGVRLPLHATAQGKLYLALRTDAEALALLHARGMQLYTPHTRTSEEAILAQLEFIRAHGYAIENGEYKIGLRAVCAPIYDRDGAAQHAVCAFGLFRHIDSEEFAAVTAATVETAQQISAALGHRSSK